MNNLDKLRLHSIYKLKPLLEKITFFLEKEEVKIRTKYTTIDDFDDYLTRKNFYVGDLNIIRGKHGAYYYSSTKNKVIHSETGQEYTEEEFKDLLDNGQK